MKTRIVKPMQVEQPVEWTPVLAPLFEHILWGGEKPL